MNKNIVYTPKMTKRHIGDDTKNQHGNNTQVNPTPQLHNISKFIKLETKKFKKITKRLVKMSARYLWIVYSTMAGYYFAILLVLGVFLLSVLLPDISQKLHKNSELKAMKNTVHQMRNEVSRAEVACLTTREEMCCLQCDLCDEGTETTQEHRNLSVCTSRGLLTTQSEPIQVEKKIGFFRRFFAINRNDSKKEIAIMSILYTDSFDSQKK